jgi:hypothetical protein
MEQRKHLFDEAVTAKGILEQLRSGKNILDTNENHSDHFEKRIIQLLHFRQYTQMYEYFFNQWEHIDLNEQHYLETAQEAKELHVLLNHQVFKETLTELLLWKSSIDNVSVELVHERCMEKVGQMWKEAKLISKIERK